MSTLRILYVALSWAVSSLLLLLYTIALTAAFVAFGKDALP